MKRILVLLFLIPHILLYSEPLASWNDGECKRAIIKFVEAVCDPAKESYLPEEQRIATFDQDGTLWVEHPIYTEAQFSIDRIKALSSKHPEWKEKEPFKAILSNDVEALRSLNDHDWLELIAVTHSGMSVDDFRTIVSDWLKTAKHPKFNRLYTDLIYQPMLELIEYFKMHSFKVYIVTGGGQDFVRAYSQSVYGIPSEQVVGSSTEKKYTYQGKQPTLIKQPKSFFIDNNAGKAIGIDLFIGKKPIAAFGNSSGDREMLEWSQAHQGLTLQMLVLHDDPVREYAYGPASGLPDTKVGTFPEALLSEANSHGWHVISMKKDWAKVFSDAKPQ